MFFFFFIDFRYFLCFLLAWSLWIRRDSLARGPALFTATEWRREAGDTTLGTFFFDVSSGDQTDMAGVIPSSSALGVMWSETPDYIKHSMAHAFNLMAVIGCLKLSEVGHGWACQAVTARITGDASSYLTIENFPIALKSMPLLSAVSISPNVRSD